MAKKIDLRTYVLLERAFIRRLQQSWAKQSALTYAAIVKACNARQWDEARRLVSDLDMTEVGTQNREWITYMLLSCATFGAAIVAKATPSFVGVGTFDTLLKQTTNNFLQYLEHGATSQVQAEALQSIAEDEAKSKVQKQEYKFGNTQIELDPWSKAAASCNAARAAIKDEDLAGAGKDVDPNHVTVRYGLLNENLDDLREFLSLQWPFEAEVSHVEAFPASDHSDGASPLVARIASPALHALEAEIGKYADFKEKSFPDYKPHCTLAYCKTEAVEKYLDLTIGGTFLVSGVTISHQSGVQETIPFGMARKANPYHDSQGLFSSKEKVSAGLKKLEDLQKTHGEVIPIGELFPEHDLNQEGVSAYEHVDTSREGKKRIMAIRHLISTQDEVDVAGLRKYLEGQGQKQADHPIALYMGGKYFLVEGHHRIGAAKLRGELVAPVEVYELARKADKTGRYVTPFVSFDQGGNAQLQLIASLNASRLATWGFTAEAEVRGIARYKLTAVLDGRTSEFCRMVNGKIFNVSDAREKVIEVLNVQNPDDLRTVQPWPKQSKAALKEYEGMSASELTDRGLHIPPFHPLCRTLLKPIESSQGQLDQVTPTIPAQVQTFQAVTASDLKEMGVEATPEQVDQWNQYVGMSPVELISKLAGMRPQDVMTKGVGPRPIVFDPLGNIAMQAKGVSLQDVSFRLGTVLDPFTGTYYLTQAALEAGTPAAEVKFLRNLFLSMIDTGLKSSATSLAVAVGGNAPYYAKLGFMPDSLEWDAIRTFALNDVDLQGVIATLPAEDGLLVTHLLQDQSQTALSALVDLPFSYQGKSIGEWVLGKISGTWALDLTDDLVVAQAKAYLS